MTDPDDAPTGWTAIFAVIAPLIAVALLMYLTSGEIRCSL